MMIRLPRCSKLRSQQVSKLSCGWIWMRKKREQVSIFLILPQRSAHRSSRLTLSKLSMEGFSMSDKISASGCTCYRASNPTFTVQPFHVHKFPVVSLKLNVGAFSLRFVCEFEQTWILSTAKLRDSQEDGNEWWTTWSVWETGAGGLCLNSISSFANPTHSKSFQH